MTVYIDVLLIFNLYINYFLISSTALVMRRKVSPKRRLLAAAVGALGSLIILLPPLPFFVTVLIKSAVGALVTFAAFGRQMPSDFAVCMLFFLLISFAYGGLMLALWHFAAPLGMVYENGTAYFNIPIGAAAIFTAAGYAAVRAVRYFADRRIKCVESTPVTISVGSHSVTLSGFPDTGNALTDIFSGKPVIICSRETISDIIPAEINEYLSGNSGGISSAVSQTLSGGIRLLPCRTVGSESLIPIFPADNITVGGKAADALIGVSREKLGNSTDCIFNPKIISI